MHTHTLPTHARIHLHIHSRMHTHMHAEGACTVQARITWYLTYNFIFNTILGQLVGAILVDAFLVLRQVYTSSSMCCMRKYDNRPLVCSPANLLTVFRAHSCAQAHRYAHQHTRHTHAHAQTPCTRTHLYTRTRACAPILAHACEHTCTVGCRGGKRGHSCTVFRVHARAQCV